LQMREPRASSAVQPADVGRPPRDSRERHVQARRNLRCKRLECRSDVSRPDGGAEALAAGPGGPAEREDLIRTRSAHSLVDASSVIEWIPVDDCGAGPGVEPE